MVLRMSIFSKLLKKESDEGRISGVERYEMKIPRSIEFKTAHGGSTPLDYDMNIGSMKLMKEESLECLKGLIDSEAIDEYSDLSVLYDMVKNRKRQALNELKRQNVNRHEVAEDIKLVSREDLHILDKTDDMLKREMQELGDGMLYSNVSSVVEKGIGDEDE